METTTVEGRRQVELEGCEEFPDFITWKCYPYGTWQIMEVVNTRDQGVSEKD